ncbi:hypothetical protein [Shinella sp. NM-101]|uniref:hypothetical protein n=1 Tax=Shinella sp. NM-101 TaxID=2744455 RepID=UPI001F169780|nr:hypothetical protein [Shinella sp. NM-101]
MKTTKQDNNLQRRVVWKDLAQWWNGRLGSVRCDFSPPAKCCAFHRIVQGWDALSARLNANGNLAAIAPGLDWRDKDTSLSVVCSMAR